MAEPDLQSVAFPTLTDAQLAEFGRCIQGVVHTYQDGETLFSVGDRDFKFFIVKSGEVAIIDYSGDEPRTAWSYHRGQFTGEISLLRGTPALASAVARGDTQVYKVTAEALRQALNRCPALSDIVLQAFIARRQYLRESPDFIGLRVLGSRYSQDTFRVRDFLAKNLVPFTWTDLETEPAMEQLLKQFGVTEADTPVVACGRKLVMRNPSNRELADKVGIHQALEKEVYDLVVVGAGPAGLAAAVYGASEGLKTVMLDRAAPGGQAGSSMRIENYLGFPEGITGSKLVEGALDQANKFGARLSVPTPVIRLVCEYPYRVVHIYGGESVVTKCLLIATGVKYRRLGVDGCEQFEGRGVYYAATPAEAQLCRDCEVLVIGGGNSAGQAAVFLAGFASRVLMLIRGDDLYKNMSSYLAQRIEQNPNIELLRSTTIQRMEGDGHLGSVVIRHNPTGQERTVETPAVFSFIGAEPRTDWLPPQIERDDKGFVRTGPELAESGHWTARRQPFILETSSPGVFAAGDVRSGSVKRVAAAVGEGSMAVQLVHEYLKGL